jgi:hypothetical protein
MMIIEQVSLIGCLWCLKTPLLVAASKQANEGRNKTINKLE